MLGDALDHVPQVGLRIEAVELGRADQGIHRGRALPAGIRAAEQVIIRPERDRAQSAGLPR